MSTSWGFNVNLLNHDCHNDTDQFINSMYSYSFLPPTTRPTRFTSISATLIANIMTNVFNDAIVSGILISDVLVHLPVFYVSNDTTVLLIPHLLLKVTGIFVKKILPCLGGIN